jgi:hypothetical protein
MPDLDQMKQGKQVVRDRRGRFANGRSGNPPTGRATAAAIRLAPTGAPAGLNRKPGSLPTATTR